MAPQANRMGEKTGTDGNSGSSRKRSKGNEEVTRPNNAYTPAGKIGVGKELTRESSRERAWGGWGGGGEIKRGGGE